MASRAWRPRRAEAGDIPAIAALIPLSVRGLQVPYYSEAQREAALGDVFAVDRQLIRDGTYFVVEDAGRMVACGGWSRRQSLCGGDHGRPGEDPPLDPAREPARIRAFFVHPDWARRGIGRALIAACEDAIRAAGFRSITLSATLAGEPLYAALGYAAGARTEVALAGGLTLGVVAMGKALSGAVEPRQQPSA
jgi:GNAT superfamily N-acetyltransferase